MTAPARHDPVAAAASTMVEGRGWGVVTAAGPGPAGARTFAVRSPSPGGGYSSRVLWVTDRGVRPPAPDGVWFEDLVSAACRLAFGCKTGTARPVQGEGVLEFRPHWAEPDLRPVAEDVVVDVSGPGRPADRRVCKVRTLVVPGADVGSVVFACVAQLCERVYGVGRLSRAAGKDHALAYAVGGVPDPALVPCRYSVTRGGGAVNEVVVMVPKKWGHDWRAVRTLLEAHCRRLFGSGTLGYHPERGETCFTFR